MALPTVKVPNIGQPPSKHKGEVATLPKRPARTTPDVCPPLRDDTVHYDIAHGTGTAIGGVKYVLLLITKEKKHLYEYPLRTLKEQSIRQALQLFINDLGYKPKYMLADRDFKLIGGAVETYLTTPTVQNNELQTTHVSGAPENRQNQNGLLESHWKKIMIALF